ncbi:glycoside hydrolase family 13 protein [Clostridium polynesiense]|uniref:glycoside hydrolase family 13 protein n=1 Tax=Clostridium polynesiense TaxID=1325933 RepID=UPI00058D9A88|nr:glycoside hydrolase family 13 protein [Clostridium polynesiense]
MNKHAIHHITDVPYVYGKNTEILIVKLRAASKEIKNCRIYYKDRYDFNGEFKVNEMYKVLETELFDFYEAEIFIEEKRYRYFFEVEDFNGEVIYYNERGVIEKKPSEDNAFIYPYLAIGDLYEEVKWAQEGIVYQIFPDRFNNGDTSNDPEGVKPWGDKVTIDNMFGGDLQGIIDKLDYFKDLGVTMIYMTPIFLSQSNHKYNTRDYYKIDPCFGDAGKARELVNKCHAAGIKVIFDAVFNHSGHDFFAFKDVMEKGQKSKYKSWYFINDYPINTENPNYITFSNYESTMPKLNTSNPEVKNYLLEVGEFWIKEAQIDGWRLDVSDEIDHSFWRAFRERIKKANEEAFIIGEIMHEGASFLRGDQMDSIMNYPFRQMCLDFFARRCISASELNHILETNRSLYTHSINKQMLNLIDSHDTPRFLTECEGDVKRMKLAVALQYTYIGIPYIYYGDEIGMEGGADPDSRRCMVWEDENQNKELFNFYKKLNYIRKNNKALVHGNYKNMFKKDNILAFKRETKLENLYIAINNNYEEKNLKVDFSEGFDLYEEKEIEIKNNEIKLEPMSFRIIKM